MAIAAVLLGATAKAIGLTVHIVETVSYVLVILIGLRLLFVKGRGFLIAWRELSSKKAAAEPAASSSEQGKSFHRHDHGPDATANNAMTTDARIMSTALIVTIMTITRRPGPTPMDRSRLNWQAAAAGAAACPRS